MMGVAKDHVLIGDNGQIFEFSNRSGHKTGHVNAGRVFVDGLGVGDVGNIVIRDRQQLAMEGVVIVVMTLAKGTGYRFPRLRLCPRFGRIDPRSS